jgi:hypothetical protein
MHTLDTRHATTLASDISGSGSSSGVSSSTGTCGSRSGATTSAQLTSKRPPQLTQPTNRQIIPRPLPITGQPGRHPTLTDTPNQCRAAHSHPVVTNINIRIEPKNTGIDRLQDARQRASLDRSRSHRIDPRVPARRWRDTRTDNPHHHRNQQNRHPAGSAAAAHN